MFKVDAEEKARAKYLVDRLAALGGFIEEEAERRLLSLYSPKLLTIARKHCNTEHEVFLVTDRMVSIGNEINANSLGDAEMLQNTLRVDDTFSGWFISQNIKAEAEYLQAEPAPENKYPDSLTALEKKILDCYLEKKMSPEKISVWLDGKDEDIYIVLLLHYIKRKLKSAEYELKELDERLEAEKLKLDW